MVGALMLVAIVAGCSGTSDVAVPTRTVPRGSIASTTTSTAVPVNFACTPTTAVVPAAGKPEVKVPDGAAPTELVKTDITVGDGPEAKVGDKVSMQYVGVAKSTGKEFDSSWKRNAEPFPFTISAAGIQGEVIEGWDQGVVGMKVGGRRELVIPPALAYKDQAKGADIGPNETLVFIVDLVQVCTPSTTAGSTPPGSASETATTQPTPSSSTPTPDASTTTPLQATTTTAKP